MQVLSPSSNVKYEVPKMKNEMSSTLTGGIYVVLFFVWAHETAKNAQRLRAPCDGLSADLKLVE